MPNKTQEYLNLAQQTAKELTRYWENWTNYLTTATYDTKTDNTPIIFGCKQGLAFYPQFERSENIRREKRFADSIRQLSLFGMGFSDERMFGIDYVKMA